MARHRLRRFVPILLTLLCGLTDLPHAALAADPPPVSPSVPPETPAPVPRASSVLMSTNDIARSPDDPVVATVDGSLIYLSTLGKTSDTLPENLRGLAFETLYPALLERMIDHQALVMMARRQGLDETPGVKREIEAAVEQVLEAVWLRREALPKVTEQAIRTRYGQIYGNRQATEEVRARHILLATESEAIEVLSELRKGADFAELAGTRSKDPDGKRGGDLGFFRREQVWPGFADIAFTLQPGQIGPEPIKNEFGWHVVKIEERRLIAPPGLADVREALRQELIAQAIRQTVAHARSQLTIRQFNMDGSPKLDATGKDRGTINNTAQ